MRRGSARGHSPGQAGDAQRPCDDMRGIRFQRGGLRQNVSSRERDRGEGLGPELLSVTQPLSTHLLLQALVYFRRAGYALWRGESTIQGSSFRQSQSSATTPAPCGGASQAAGVASRVPTHRRLQVRHQLGCSRRRQRAESGQLVRQGGRIVARPTAASAAPATLLLPLG